MAKPRVLVVDDERAQRDAIGIFLTARGYQVDVAADGSEALDALTQNAYVLMITDLRLPGIDGLEVIRRAREIDEQLGVLLVTAYASVESAVEALRVGADDYLLKPLILEEVARKATDLLAKRELVRENLRLRRAISLGESDHTVVAESVAMKDVLKWVARASESRSNVLITGETGTGKEVIAKAIHDQGPTSGAPFMAINLASIPKDMAESELFGHEKGAFTGADRRREGLLRAAAEGTVMLDEVGELPLASQAKLLRAIEAREVRPLGSDRTMPFEARILAATHRDLDAMVKAGEFRQDLFYRLNVIAIHIPPLRERPEDIPVLVRRLLERHTEGSPTPVIDGNAMRALCAYPWRGNVRELSNVLERALILANEGRIDAEMLPEDVRESAGTSLELQEAIDRFERGHIVVVLRVADGNRERAAELLGISPATLYRHLERLGLKGYDVRGT